MNRICYFRFKIFIKILQRYLCTTLFRWARTNGKQSLLLCETLTIIFSQRNNKINKVGIRQYPFNTDFVLKEIP